MAKKEKRTAADLEIRQSRELTLSAQDFSLLEMKLKYKIIERLQFLFNGVKLHEGMVKADLVKPYTVVIPLAELIDPDHYGKVRKAARRLMDVTLSYEDETYEWIDFKFITTVRYPRKSQVAADGTRKKKYSDSLELDVNEEFIKVLVKQGGWQTFYEIDAMMSLRSVYSMRLYELVSRQDNLGHSLNFRLSELKRMWGIEPEKWKREFGNKLLKPCMEELDEKCPYSFDYEIGSLPDGEAEIRIMPRKVKDNLSEAVAARRLRRDVSLFVSIDEMSKSLLKSDDFYGFTDLEIHNNLDTILDFQVYLRDHGEKLPNFLVKAYPLSLEKNNPKGWLIGTMKAKMDEN